MTIVFEFCDKGGYLVATIPDTVINSQRARTILKSVDNERQKYNCRKVLVNEMALERRKIASHEIRGFTEIIPDIRLAFLCRPELIDNNTRLFSALSFTDDYMVRHFSVKGEAINWLMSQRGS